jgi:hypothetical protein
VSMGRPYHAIAGNRGSGVTDRAGQRVDAARVSGQGFPGNRQPGVKTPPSRLTWTRDWSMLLIVGPEAGERCGLR